MDADAQPGDDPLRDSALRTARAIRAARQRCDAERSEAERRREEQLHELKGALALLEATLESTPDAIVATGLDGCVLLHNRRWAALWGWDDATLVGQPRAALDAQVAARLLAPQHYLEHVRSKAVGDEPQAFEHADGRWFERVVATAWIDGAAAGRVEHWREVTERVRRDEAQRAAEVERRVSQAKSHFMSRMSHELRTPLNAILGFAQLMQLDPADAPRELTQRRAGLVIGAGRHLLALVDDLLYIARIEAGALELKPEALNVAELLDDAIALTRALAEAHQVQLGVVMHADTALALRADRARLRQALVNLISNACKYNHPGGRAVLRVDATRERVEIAVRDSGAGMTREQIDQLFEPLARPPSDGVQGGGSGLGLVITRQLALAMNGSLELVSAPGEGTTATLSLPRA